MKRKNSTEPCPFCGSTSPRATLPGTDTCSNERTCNERRCERRKREDDKRGVRGQCHATRGARSVKFCLLSAGHHGLHLNGTLEWSGDEEHPVAAALRL
jgi:hypothetical protein